MRCVRQISKIWLPSGSVDEPRAVFPYAERAYDPQQVLHISDIIQYIFDKVSISPICFSFCSIVFVVLLNTGAPGHGIVARLSTVVTILQLFPGTQSVNNRMRTLQVCLIS